jgi:membrane-associated protease RseP (regulator of RpoE activity)
MPSGRALVTVVSVIAYVLARKVGGPLTPQQLLLMLLALEFVVQPVSTLIHELGHAVVARRVTRKPVAVMVGRGPYAKLAFAGVRVNFSLLPARGMMIAGVCRSDASEASWHDRAAIALAGPVATVFELLGVVVTASVVWSHAGPLPRNLLAVTAVGLLSGAVWNLIPRALAGGINNDGLQALTAVRNHRAGMPLPAVAPPVPAAAPDAPASAVAISAPVAVSARVPAPAAVPALVMGAVAMSARELDLARARTSVPPPPPPRRA